MATQLHCISVRLTGTKRGFIIKLKFYSRTIVQTPGEKGTHLITVEITYMKGLKGVEPQNYWQQVQKKAQVLLNTIEKEGKAILQIFGPLEYSK